jgi:anti-sigma regulatory factor (Ser/Thr protein kinase)
LSVTESEQVIPIDATRVELRSISDAAVAAAMVRHVALSTQDNIKLSAANATVAAELATNVVRHGKGGELFVWVDAGAFHIATLDNGSGNAQAILEWVQREGVNRGLAAVRRLMGELHLTNRAGGGLFVHAVRRGRSVP